MAESRFPVFQAGPRVCLGQAMAVFEAKLVAALLLQEFTFSMDPAEAAKVTYSMTITMAVSNSPTQASHHLWLTPHRRE